MMNQGHCPRFDMHGARRTTMPKFDAFHLARAQFAFTVGFHIVLPAFSIGLASYLAVLEALWLRTGRQIYLDVFKFWLKIFSVGFAMGVVSGLVMSYEFGTNWSVFSDKAGPVIGPLMGYEVLTAFFLEAGFLGVMLFGMERVGKGLHMFATCMVAAGTFMSAFWILSVNSWMQTPAGYTVSPAGQFLPADWWAIVFNPSFHVRLPHMLMASYLSVAFTVGATGAWHLLRDRRAGRPMNEAARLMFSMSMWMATILAPMQIVMGDLHGLNTLEHQPAKIAAMEGNWHAVRGAPLVLFGLPNMAEERTDYKIEIPYLSSLILTHSLDGEVPGLDSFPRADRPNAAIVFWSFRVMVGLGMLMALVGAAALVLRRGGRLYRSGLLLWAVLLMAPSGFIALLSGWVTTEVGRQPFTVYGVLRTVDSVSPIGTPGVATSFALFCAVYLVVYTAGFVILLRLMGKTPVRGERGPELSLPTRSAGITPGLPQAAAHGIAATPGAA